MWQIEEQDWIQYFKRAVVERSDGRDGLKQSYC
jgi:hypothetical protein